MDIVTSVRDAAGEIEYIFSFLRHLFAQKNLLFIENRKVPKTPCKGATKGVGRKFSREGGQRKKYRKLAKKYRK